MHKGQGENAIGTLLIFSICKMDAILWLWDDICQKQKEQIMLQRKCFGETGDVYSSESIFKISYNLGLFMICFKSVEDISKLLREFFCRHDICQFFYSTGVFVTKILPQKAHKFATMSNLRQNSVNASK